MSIGCQARILQSVVSAKVRGVMSKPDPYGDWVLFPASDGDSKNPATRDDELILAAREVWPRALAHAKKDLSANRLGADSASVAAQVWERMLLSVSRTRRRDLDRRQNISDLQSYLFLAFIHRYNRAVQREQKYAETIELVSSSVDLERLASAEDVGWVEELERAIAIKQVANHMDPWTKKAWQARQYGYSWREIAVWSGLSEQTAKKKFEYGLEKTRQRLVRLLKARKQKSYVSSQPDSSSQ